MSAIVFLAVVLLGQADDVAPEWDPTVSFSRGEGLSTGPHLHFEVPPQRKNEQGQDMGTLTEKLLYVQKTLFELQLAEVQTKYDTVRAQRNVLAWLSIASFLIMVYFGVRTFVLRRRLRQRIPNPQK